jgi:hypothetical protein
MNNLGRGDWLVMSLLFCVGFAILVGATNPTWQGYSGVNYTTIEDTSYSYNLSANITGFNNDILFAIDTNPGTYIQWTNSTGVYNVTASYVSSWISIVDTSNGNLSINATRDNQTGFFRIPFQAYNITDDPDTSSGVGFNFIINATNDAPNLTVFSSEYDLTQDELFLAFVNASDEENHYPLGFNITFNNNCTHAEWTGRLANENCSILNLTGNTNASAYFNYTPTTLDVGTYWAWINLTDAGANYPCPHDYCDNTTYKQNKTGVSQLVKFNVFSSLGMNITNCTEQNLTEGVPFVCYINISTQGETDAINISSYAFYRTGYAGPVSNRSWFYANASTVAVNFNKEVQISFTPTKREVGNWTINFTAVDYDYGVSRTGQINLYVNWTESSVSLTPIGNQSVYENRTFYINATDPDLLVQDKSVKNEVLTFQTNTSWVTVESTETLSGNNYTNATIKIDYDAVRLVGDANYTVKINVTDTSGSSDEEFFVVEILTDTAPLWNVSKTYVNASNEGDNLYINLTNGWVNDTELDVLTFYYTNATPFEHFNLTSAGIINFTSSDADVGFHNITLIAGDGKLNTTTYFNFTIYNVVDTTIFYDILPAGTITVEEGNLGWINLTLYDDDYLIPDEQVTLYNESLTVTVGVSNLTSVNTPISFEFLLSNQISNQAYFNANFTPDGVNVGEYNITINVTDRWGGINTSYVTLNITSINDAPVLDIISNQTKTINDNLTIQANATDEEGNTITYAIYNLTVGGNFLTINETTGLMNITLNSTYAGFWEYNVTANDTLTGVGFRLFTLTVYGAPVITSPSSDYVFNWTEANATGPLFFNVSYAVNNTNLTYKIYMDKVVYYNATYFNYTDLIVNTSLRNETNFTLRDSNNFTWNFTSNYTDETYGLLKNITLLVYNPNYPELNHSVNWKVNISHQNQNVTFKTGAYITDKGPVSYGTGITINLSQYFEDADYWDRNISQTVNFTLETVSAGTSYIESGSSNGFNGWTLTLSSLVATTEILKINAYEWNSSNQTIHNASSNEFQVEFVEPSVTSVEVPTSGGGGSNTKLKHYSLKLIVPQDVIISDKNYIEIPFSVQNTGQIDMRGINLSSFVRFNDDFADDVKISLGESYIPELKFGQSENFTMRISANTQRAGKYKATIYANVTSPKFSDWGDFYIELKKTNDSEAEQILIFTEKLVAENPECLELTELLKEAQEAFDLGEYSNSLRISQEVTAACEEAVKANEQVRYPISGFVKDNFYYISFTTLVIFLVGFVFYIYKRVRFNKSKMSDYI